MSAEVLLAVGYAVVLALGAATLELLSALTHRRALRYRTAGFTYHADDDHWRCPEDQPLWPHAVDHELRLVRYRAHAGTCNRCLRKHACTDSDDGRGIARPLDPWPHSEAGRFHRVISLSLVALGVLLLVVEVVRHHRAPDVAALSAGLLVVGIAGVWLFRDLRVHPANFPAELPPTRHVTR
jgi:hypothetical protein